MIIQVLRDVFTEASTTSRAMLEGVAPFFFLELPRVDEHGARNVPRKTCVPPGKYPLRLRWSPHNGIWVPELVGVQGRSEIEIHPGNIPADLRGCLAPGLSRSEDRVDRSRAMHAIIVGAMIEAVRNNEPAEIDIREAS